MRRPFPHISDSLDAAPSSDQWEPGFPPLRAQRVKMTVIDCDHSSSILGVLSTSTSHESGTGRVEQLHERLLASTEE